MSPISILRKRSIGILPPLVILTLFALLPQPAKAGDFCSFGGGDGGWDGSLNWSCGRVPGPGDTALIDHNQNESLQTVRVASDVTVGTLSLAGNIACGVSPAGNPVCGNLTVLNNLDGREGTIDGEATTVAAGTTANIYGPNDKWLTHSRHMTNYGTITWSGSNITGNYGILEINNMAGAVVDAQGDAWISLYSGDGFNLNNYGTFRKSASTGETVLLLTFNNNGGTIDAQTGTIHFDVAAGHFDDGSSFTSGGITRLENSTWTFNGIITPTRGATTTRDRKGEASSPARGLRGRKAPPRVGSNGPDARNDIDGG